MLLAEDLLLLMTDPVSGARKDYRGSLSRGLAAAVLVELALDGAVRSGEPTKWSWGWGRFVVADTSPPDDPLLSDVLQVLHTEAAGLSPVRAVRKLAVNPADLYRRMADQQVVRRAGVGWHVFGPGRCWPVANVSYVATLRHRVFDVLVEEAEPDTGTAALIALLVALRSTSIALRPLFRGDFEPVYERAWEVRKSPWVAEPAEEPVHAALWAADNRSEYALKA